jgi:hypothetical protein
MNIQEYALLFVAVAPVATIAVTNLFLMFVGERGTLLFPPEVARRAA